MSVQFGVGDRVRVRTGQPSGHCRTPSYLRGKCGVVIGFQGVFADPEKRAYHKPGLPRQPLYMVRFDYGELWPGRRSGSNDSICADIYHHWLDADS